jgi:hypothetical protein
MKFTVILGPEPDGGYSVFGAALPGCVSQGADWAQDGLPMTIETHEVEVEAEVAA